MHLILLSTCWASREVTYRATCRATGVDDTYWGTREVVNLATHDATHEATDWATYVIERRVRELLCT